MTTLKKFSAIQLQDNQVLTKEQQKSLKGGSWTPEQCFDKCQEITACQCNSFPYSAWQSACGRYFLCEAYV